MSVVSWTKNGLYREIIDARVYVWDAETGEFYTSHLFAGGEDAVHFARLGGENFEERFSLLHYLHHRQGG